MKNEALYHKTVDILVQAYFNDTLKHGSVCGCAVGNLVCANLYNGDMKEWNKSFEWKESWNTVIDYSFRHPKMDQYNGNRKEQIDSTGYTVEELVRIEKSFEFANQSKTYSEENMFNGLMAVIDCLDEIHEVNSPEVSKTSKLKFQKINK